jgi:hypothetical protein
MNREERVETSPGKRRRVETIVRRENRHEGSRQKEMEKMQNRMMGIQKKMSEMEMHK